MNGLKKVNGFTLIELLVVISIIALLLAILMPALNKVKEHGRTVVCLANMKSLGLSWVLYSEDNDGKMMGGSTYSRDPSVRADWIYIPPELCTWADFDSNPLTYEQRENTLKDGALWEYLGNVKSYKCPGDRKDYLRSYCVSNPMNGDIGWDNAPYMITKSTQINNPSSKLVFVEYDDPRIFRFGPFVCMVETEQFVDMVSLWHNDKSNFAFADGHSEPHKWIDQRTIDIAESGEFYQFSADNPDLEWLQKSYNPKR